MRFDSMYLYLYSIFIGKFATLDTMHALCLPLGASISLLVMFFFFDSMQMLFAVCTASKLKHFVWNSKYTIEYTIHIRRLSMGL